MTEPEYVTPAELAAMLNVERKTLCRWRQDGVGPRWVMLTGRTFRYARADVQSWIDSLPTTP